MKDIRCRLGIHKMRRRVIRNHPAVSTKAPFHYILYTCERCGNV